MAFLASLPIPKALALASLPHNSHANPNPPPAVRRIKAAPPPPPSPPPPNHRHDHPKRQPSVAEIERAIGSGIFRDRDPRGLEQNKNLFDAILSNSTGETEGSAEKKLREIGEWIIERTEGRSSRSAGKKILMGMFQWVLPIWMFLLLVASGVIKLPFNTPFLDDLIM